MKKTHFNYLYLFSFIFLFAACNQADNEPLRLAFLTDIHVQPDAESSEQLKMLVEEVNTTDLDMVIISGDLSNRGAYDELINVKNILDQLTIPYHVIPGNHEMNWSESAGRDFVSLWGDDKFIFQKGDFLLAGINTGPFMRMGDGHVKQEDIRWLEQELSNRNTSELQLLFFAHYPLAEGLDQWYEITDILHEHDAIASFCGHGHTLKLNNFDGIPGIMGRSLVLRGENTPGYNIVEVDADSLKVFEKVIGQPTGEPRIAFATDQPETAIEDLPVSPLPDYSVNSIFEHILPLFRHTDTASVFTGPLVLADTMVIYGNSAGWLKAIHVPSGEVRWQNQLVGPIFSTPALTPDNKVIAADTDGTLVALNPTDGSVQWQINTEGPVIAPPLIHDEYVYLGTGKEGMHKIKASTGEKVWSFTEVEGLIQSKASIEDDQLIFTAWDTHVYSLDTETGALLWKWNNGQSAELLSPGNVVPVISHGKVFIVAPDRFMTALDLRTGQEVWRTNRHQVRESMGVSDDGELIFAKLMNDSVIAVPAEPDSFATKWVADAGFGYDHNPVPILSENNTLYMATRNGLVAALNRENGEVEWKHKTSHSAVNFFFDGKSDWLWFSTANGEIIALPRH